ncbi:MAG: hypothetical protein A2270_11030 [Elusimicrobia bacterium RIFOXYA12_FULL_51_18]|nr:MAG: hypothetical protein A2270_11030 [Elusimicrobia bacterium RIFOXYA12_FULL_51_18]OGS32313.1 MAG: hypothetical protein A2218_02870 [Elusimicrobia bacterium RIFOXYA2_FULL_53_38]
MNYRRLGSTELNISEIGFGAWGLGGDKGGSRAYGPTDDSESLYALRRALDLGITFFDTADFYGFGHSETLIGRAFGACRERVIIAGKAGFVDAAGRQDFSPAHIRASLDGTLRRLNTDYLDVYQLHSPPAELLIRTPGILETMKELVREGRIRSYGVSLRSPEDGITLLRAHKVGCLQVNFNLVDQRARADGLFELCRQTDTGIIARTPLCFGFLTGQYPDTSALPESDHRRRWSKEQVERWHKAPRLFAGALETQRPQTPAQSALRFCISYPAVTSVIPGMLTPAQVEENAAASGLGPLPAETISEVQAIYEANDFMGRK